MDKARLEEIELRLHRVSSDACGGPGADEDMGVDAPFWQHAREDVQELLAEVRQQAALLERFEKDGEQYLLGKEAGRLEVLLKWAKETRIPRRVVRPDGAKWFRDYGNIFYSNGNDLPAGLFDCLEGGRLDEGGNERPEREYPSSEEAMAALFAACRKRARSPLA